MLVLSRQVDQIIMIGDDIEIVVTSIRGDKVRLGITAPTSMTIHRKKIYDEIQDEKLNDHLDNNVITGTLERLNNGNTDNPKAGC